MSTRRLVVSSLVLAALFLFLAGAPGLARSPRPGSESAHPLQRTPLGTTFTYQGYLAYDGSPADGLYDMTFQLYDAPTGGDQIGDMIAQENIAADKGLFATALDFGREFRGRALYMEIAVRPGASTGTYTTLQPRQSVAATPYALGLPFGVVVEGETVLHEPGFRVYNKNTTAGSGIYAEASAGGLGGYVYGAVIGYSNAITDGYGVIGSTASTSQGAGVAGLAQGTGGAGVVGRGGGDAVGVRGYHVGGGASPGVLGETGSTDNYASGVAGVVNSDAPGEYSAGVAGVNLGQGYSGVGVYGAQRGSGFGVYGEVNSATGAGSAIVGYAVSPDASALVAQHASPTGTALRITGGALRVTGAGLGTSTPVFVHLSTAANVQDYCTVIDHPLTNGDPNAILIVTHSGSPGGSAGPALVHPYGVLFENSRWSICNEDFAAMPAGEAFNVLVVKP